MAIPQITIPASSTAGRPPADSGAWATVKRVLVPLSSLKLTVALLAMSAFIVLAGTLAQVDADVWEAVRRYFRIDTSELIQSRSLKEVFMHLFVWIDCQIFAPPAFFPSKPDLKPWVGFWFPRGWTIGAVMMANLFAAHLVRFKKQATGTTLWAGIGVIILGCILTWAVIDTASTADAIQTNTVIGYDRVWQLMGLSILAISGCLVFMGLSDGNKPIERLLYLGTAVLAGLSSAGVLLVPPLEDPSMRILYQLLKGTICGLVLLAGCWLVFRKRAGIVLLHAGIGMLMVYEILVGMNAGTMEASMSIAEGQTAVYTTDIRSSELVVADLSDAKEDVETIIPGRLLKPEAKFDDKQLPFVVEVLDYHPHSTLYNKKAGFLMTRPGQQAEEPKTPDLATEGLGKTFRIAPLDPSVGTDTSGAIDTPSAYVRVTSREDGKQLGTYMVTTIPGFDRSEPIEFQGKKYELELRFRRTYTPYHVTLKDVQKNTYVGTDRPKDFRSIVTLIDTSRSDAKPIDSEIWMNNPLRYGGFTFYQSNYDPGRNGREVTSLQVVENEGWTIPYLACMITGVGMLFQFFQVLVRFLGKAVRSTSANASVTTLPNAETKKSRKYSVLAAAAATVMFAAIVMTSTKEKKLDPKFDLNAFAQVPIFYEGRAQPIDSLARNSMLFLNDRETYRENDKTEPAIRWLLDVITDSPNADKHPVFQIENLDLQKALGLENRERFRYAPSEFQAKLEGTRNEDGTPKDPGMLEEIAKLREIKTENLNLYERKLLSLERRVRAMRKLKFMFIDPTTVQPMPPLPTPESIKSNPTLAQEQMGAVRSYLDSLKKLVTDEQFAIVVPMQIGAEKERLSQALSAGWSSYFEACAFSALEDQFGMDPVPAMKHWRGMLESYKANKPEEFNAHVADYLKLLQGASKADLTVKSTGAELELKKTNFEYFFNRVGPFNLASYLYVGAFVLVALGWVLSQFGGMRPLHSAAFALAILTFGMHAAAIVGRIYISGRPPVTNLYSAAVFIGCAAALFSLVTELFFRRGLGTTLACAAGFLSLRVAQGLSTDGDTFAVLQAVLDTQFWLATHVVTITLGYATTYVAGFIGVIYIIGGVITPAFSEKDRQRLYSMMYGTTCFAIFFSFIGTVLGGLWADDSWGRFWGWDPKENGALIIVIWNALVLHARWGGMIRARGMAILSVLGNIVVSWSFFGVNELGVGLHAYGLTEGRMFMLAMFALSQLAIAAVGLIPERAWWSFQAHADSPTREPEELDSMV